MRHLMNRIVAAVAAFRSAPSTPVTSKTPTSTSNHTDNAIHGDVSGTAIQAGHIGTIDQSRHETNIENQTIGVQSRSFTGIGHLSGNVDAPIIFGNSGTVTI